MHIDLYFNSIFFPPDMSTNWKCAYGLVNSLVPRFSFASCVGGKVLTAEVARTWGAGQGGGVAELRRRAARVAPLGLRSVEVSTRLPESQGTFLRLHLPTFRSSMAARNGLLYLAVSLYLHTPQYKTSIHGLLENYRRSVGLHMTAPSN